MADPLFALGVLGSRQKATMLGNLDVIARRCAVWTEYQVFNAGRGDLG